MTLEELLDRIKLEAEFGKEQSDAGISSALASALDEIVVIVDAFRRDVVEH